jgi:cell wall-associated NlpC family hydrolase
MVGLAASQTKTNTIRNGDIASGIAKKSAVSQKNLLRENSLTSTQQPKVGAKPAVPGKHALLAASGKSAPAKARLYTVRQGDNDWVISQRFKLTEHQLHLLNPSADWKHLKPGLQLRVSSGAAGASSVASSHVASAKPVKAKTVAKSSAKTYTVKNGDNDWVIAGRVGMTPNKLRSMNPGTNWDRLQIGSKLRVSGTVVAAVKSKSIRSRYAKIARDAVIVRRNPGTSADKVTVVEAGLPVTVLDRDSGWYKLKFPKGTVGWVRGDMLKSAKKPMVAQRTRTTRTRVATRSRSHSSKTRVAMRAPADASPLLKKAYSRMGQRYVYGANDCSGFVMSVYRTQGVSLPHSSRAQSGLGRRVPKGELQPGDLVFFKTNRGTRVNHVGIYTGGGKFIHASSGGGKVQVNSLSDGYYNKRFAGARRVLKASAKSKK